jgi:hypothetical protein
MNYRIREWGIGHGAWGMGRREGEGEDGKERERIRGAGGKINYLVLNF